MAFQLTARTMSSPSPGRRPAFSHASRAVSSWAVVIRADSRPEAARPCRMSSSLAPKSAPVPASCTFVIPWLAARARMPASPSSSSPWLSCGTADSTGIIADISETTPVSAPFARR